MARPAPVAMARRIVAAAVELSGDDPNRAVTIEAILAHLEVARDMEFVGAMAEAITRGWLAVNSGEFKHTVKVGPAWRRERARRR